MEMATPARIKVFWQPGCSSCLRTKEFLTKQGIDFESVNVHGNPEGMAQLTALGARSVPVVSLGNQYTLCQSFGDVVKFLDLKTKLMDPLSPQQLLEKIDLVLTSAARYVRQFPPAALHEVFRNRNRTPAGTAFHVFRLSEMGMQAAQQIPLTFEGFNDVPPPDWDANRIAEFGLDVRARIRDWWSKEPDRSFELPRADLLRPAYLPRRDRAHGMARRTAHPPADADAGEPRRLSGPAAQC